MAKRTPPPTAPFRSDLTLDAAIQLLENELKRGQALAGTASVDKETFGDWESHVEAAINRYFGPSSDQISRFYRSGETTRIVATDPYSSDFYSEPIIDKRPEMVAKVKTLESIIERMKEEQKLLGQANSSSSNPIKTSIGEESTVFLVHGRDHGAKNTVARFLEPLVKVIILDEQDNAGMTVIEKLETHSLRAGYAVILYTGDDLGKLKGEEDLKPRARQNVVMELGYFIGKLGRSNVTVLCEKGVERPSDFSGVVYEAWEPTSDSWKLRLVKELKRTGFTIDMNKAFQ